MKILTVSQAYPNEKALYSMAFVHSRDLLYKKAGHEVEVLSFAARENYNWSGIQVWTEASVTKDRLKRYDAVVFHAPNLRNHLRFLRKNKDLIARPFFIIHMTEWISRAVYHPKPYSFFGFFDRKVKPLFAWLYDSLKLSVWRSFLKRQRVQNLKLIFVSDWILEHAQKSIGYNVEKGSYPYYVVHNPIHPAFIENEYSEKASKDADFVTIRPFDESKYGVDIVCELARRYPDKTFHLYGRGSYFKYNQIPPNMKVFEKMIPQTEIPQLLNRYRSALLPTRLDSQGVLMCEIAAMGMPLIVSDLPICREMVGNFSNVAYLNNDNPRLPNLPPADAVGAKRNSEKFWASRTIAEELRIFDQR